MSLKFRHFHKCLGGSGTMTKELLPCLKKLTRLTRLRAKQMSSVHGLGTKSTMNFETPEPTPKWTEDKLPQPEPDFNYLCDPNNTQEIRENIANRKGRGDIDQVVSLHHYQSQFSGLSSSSTSNKADNA